MDKLQQMKNIQAMLQASLDHPDPKVRAEAEKQRKEFMTAILFDLPIVIR